MESSRPKRQNAGTKIRGLIEKEISKKGEQAFAESDNEIDKDYSIDVTQVSDQDMYDSDFEETDSEAEAASIAAMEQVEQLIAENEKMQARRKRKHMIIPKFAKSRLSNLHHKTPIPTVSGNKARKKKAPCGNRQRLSSRENSIQSSKSSFVLYKQREMERKISAEKKMSSIQEPKEPELTQEVILEEAKQTELENIELLKQMVLDQEQALKSRLNSMKFKKPQLLYPIVQQKSSSKTSDTQSSAEIDHAITSEYTIKFNNASDAENFDLSPWKNKDTDRRVSTCPITGKSAKYIHPKTGIPFANLLAYKALEKLCSDEFAFQIESGTWAANYYLKKGS